MDERTLNDLLECSVCLERLDTSSKVLPCQHTFCRKCLEVILVSRQELRCPECRQFVDIKIDDLPPNVLLMRILEGMKNTAVTLANQSPKVNIGSKTECTQNPNDQQHPQFRKVEQLHQTTQMKSSNSLQWHSMNSSNQQRQLNLTNSHLNVPHAIALYDFQSKEINDLNFMKGDIILLKRKIDANWFIGGINGREGTFPSNRVQVIIPLPSPQCIALYDFKMGPNEEEGCLIFKKGTVINVLRRVDHNWAEGRIGNSIGIFPIAFVEMNKLAKQLLKDATVSPIAASLDIPHQQSTDQQIKINAIQNRNLPSIPFETNLNDSTSSSSSTCTPNTATSPHSTSSSNSSSNSIPNSPIQSNPTSPQNNPAAAAAAAAAVSVRYRDGKEKRHSLNALLPAKAGSTSGTSSGFSLSSVQTNRHSAEILSIPVASSSSSPLSSSCTTSVVATKEDPAISLGQKVRMRMGVDGHPDTLAISSASVSAPVSLSRINVLKTNQQNILPTLPWGYLALYPYKPRKNDELELKKGCVYVVTERCLDGWFKGKNWQDISGVFPGNYVTPLRNRDQQQLMHQWKFVQNQPILQEIPIQQTATQQQQQSHVNNRIGHNMSTIHLPHQPPELPPRQVLSTTSAWAKPVDFFFNRNNMQTEQIAFASENNEKKQNQTIKEATLSSCFSVNNTIGNYNTTTTASNQNSSKIKEKKESSNCSSSGTSTSTAVSLMKRLASIKTRSKSPNIINNATRPNSGRNQNQSSQDQTLSVSFPQENNKSPNTVAPGKSSNATITHNPVHIRSGSCPSQLLQNLPTDEAASNLPTETSVNQQSCGSQRLKGTKERPHLQNLRQSVDGSFHGITAAGGGLLMAASSGNVTAENNQNQNPNHLLSQQQQYQHHQQTSITVNHKKSQSLDTTAVLSTLVRSPPSDDRGGTSSESLSSVAAKTGVYGRDSRFRCIVSYPPNSDLELELNAGDIVYVHRKQKNGWYKGTHSRTNKSGLFPASFVEPDI